MENKDQKTLKQLHQLHQNGEEQKRNRVIYLCVTKAATGLSSLSFVPWAFPQIWFWGNPSIMAARTRGGGEGLRVEDSITLSQGV